MCLPNASLAAHVIIMQEGAEMPHCRRKSAKKTRPLYILHPSGRRTWQRFAGDLIGRDDGCALTAGPTQEVASDLGLRHACVSAPVGPSVTSAHAVVRDTLCFVGSGVRYYKGNGVLNGSHTRVCLCLYGACDQLSPPAERENGRRIAFCMRGRSAESPGENVRLIVSRRFGFR